MGPALPAEEHRPDNDYLPSVESSSSIFSVLTFSGDITHHHYNRSLLADRIQEDLRHRLSCRRRHSRLVVLNTEKQAQDKEPTEDRRDSDRHDDANWSRHGRIMGLLGHMRARIKS